MSQENIRVNRGIAESVEPCSVSEGKKRRLKNGLQEDSPDIYSVYDTKGNDLSINLY